MNPSKQPQFYLASKSPRRKELLTLWGYHFAVLSSGDADSVNEEAAPGEAPADYVRRVTREKAQWGARTAKEAGLPPLPVLASDTAVTLGGEIFGKPQSSEDAFRILTLLSGRTHEVLTAVAVLTEDGTLFEDLSISQVRFKALSNREICAYIASKEAMDKAGAYGIQGKAGAFVEEIKGSFSGIMGLPQKETVELLEAAGIAYLV